MDKLTPKEQIRVIALSETAHMGLDHSDAEDILETAREFEKFIRGGESGDYADGFADGNKRAWEQLAQREARILDKEAVAILEAAKRAQPGTVSPEEHERIFLLGYDKGLEVARNQSDVPSEDEMKGIDPIQKGGDVN